MLHRLPGVAVLAVALVSVSFVTNAGADNERGRQVYDSANCVGCHKWHGGGGGGYGGAALSLRETPLDRDGLIEVVRCGRPATRMPYHDRDAWANAPCYGMDESDIGDDMPPRAAGFLREAQIEAVADYVLVEIKGKGEPTYDDCVAYWGEGARQCEAMR